MSFHDLTDDELEAYENQLDALTEKDLLIHQLVELQRIRYTLELMAGPTEPQNETESEAMYECNQCGDIVPKDDRESHASIKHNWMPAVSAISDEFTEV